MTAGGRDSMLGFRRFDILPYRLLPSPQRVIGPKIDDLRRLAVERDGVPKGFPIQEIQGRRSVRPHPDFTGME
jgi:hypothetical protein